MKKKIYVAPRVLQVINDALCLDETPQGSVIHGGAKDFTLDFNEEEEGVEEYIDPWN
jgi:hypothetical protein